MHRRLFKELNNVKIICCLIIIGTLSYGCGFVEGIRQMGEQIKEFREEPVRFNKKMASVLGDVGIISVFEIRGLTTGDPIKDSLHGVAELDKEIKNVLREANPAQELINQFISKFSPAISSQIIPISEKEIEYIREEKGLIKAVYYEIEKLDLPALKKKFNIDTLIVLKTRDATMYDPSLQSEFSLKGYKDVIYKLNAKAKMISLSSGKTLWEPRWIWAEARPMAKPVYRGLMKEVDYEVESIDSVRWSNHYQIEFIVNELIKDLW